MSIFGPTLRALARLLLRRQVKALHRDLSDLLASYGDDLGTLVPPVLRRALVAAEDHRFYDHCGVDPIALLRAFYQLICYGRLQGASTIEQQLVRTVTNRYERTLRRKLREVLLATCVSEVLTKEEASDLYLMVAYYGWGMDGLCRACGSVGVRLCAMSAFEAASLVALLKYPQRRHPRPVWELRFRRRVQHILRLAALGRGQALEALSTREANAATVRTSY
jgi:penicillin-binding protein 1A